MSEDKLLPRKDALVESTWNREAVYPTWDDWDADFKIAQNQLLGLEKYPGRLQEGPEMLLDWQSEYSRQYTRLWKLSQYARRSVAVDANEMQAKSRLGQITSLVSQFMGAIAFAEPEMQSIGEQLIVWAETHPELRSYQHHFENLLRLAPHQRSAEVEKLLKSLEILFAASEDTYSELTNTDLIFKDAVDSQGNSHPVKQTSLPPLGIDSLDRTRRRTAWESFSDGHLAMQNTLASIYLNQVKQRVFISQERGYDSVLDMMLTPTNLPVSAFHSLIETFHQHLPVWHRYWEARRKLLGVEQLHPYDIWAPLTHNPPVIPYRQAVDWISAAMAPLGEEYVNLLRSACLEERWVDYAPTIGKAQGAASSLHIETPPFIYMSYIDTFDSMGTLAHELGHSMHDYFTGENQPIVYNTFDAMSSAVAETASNFNQAMLRAYLRQLKPDDRDFQLALLDEAMANFHRYLFIMPTLARFEYEIYQRAEQNQPLSAPILNEILSGLYAEEYGETMHDDPQRTAITWAQFGHLYEPFYTFQYSVGISAAHALVDRVLAEGAPAAQDYIEFLKAGASLYPMELFKLAGVEMQGPEPVEKAFAVLAVMIDQLDELADE
jgi:oligoendopeptidase F